jgi:hypothetical protein
VRQANRAEAAIAAPFRSRVASRTGKGIEHVADSGRTGIDALTTARLKMALDPIRRTRHNGPLTCRCGGMVDAADSKSAGSDVV